MATVMKNWNEFVDFDPPVQNWRERNIEISFQKYAFFLCDFLQFCVHLPNWVLYIILEVKFFFAITTTGIFVFFFFSFVENIENIETSKFVEKLETSLDESFFTEKEKKKTEKGVRFVFF